MGQKIQFLSQEQRRLRAIIASGDAPAIINWADEIGQQLAKEDLATSQIRNVFGAVRQIRMGWDRNPAASFRQAVLLIPKIGYYAQRERGRGKRGMLELERVLTPALQMVAEAKDKAERRKRFMNFADFFEAILAYHKKYGGRD